MATVAERKGQHTFDEFLLLVKEYQKADLLDGVIYMASPESTDDNKLGGWLYRLMAEYVIELDLGEVYYSRVAFRITEKRGPEPDVAFVAKSRLRLVERGFVDGAPDIAVEIVSPDSVQRDYDKKRTIYEKAGVKEYWIIDPAERENDILATVAREIPRGYTNRNGIRKQGVARFSDRCAMVLVKATSISISHPQEIAGRLI